MVVNALFTINTFGKSPSTLEPFSYQHPPPDTVSSFSIEPSRSLPLQVLGAHTSYLLSLRMTAMESILKTTLRSRPGESGISLLLGMAGPYFKVSWLLLTTLVVA